MFDSKGNKVPAQIYNCIIIGAGISGITFAHKLSIKGEAVLVLEKEHRVGGQINTFYSQDKAGTWAEAGSHTCYNSYTHLLSVADEVKHTDSLLPLRKCRYVIFDENRLKRPFGLISMPRMMLNGWRCFFLSMKGKTVRQYFGRIVGKAFKNTAYIR